MGIENPTTVASAVNNPNVDANGLALPAPQPSNIPTRTSTTHRSGAGVTDTTAPDAPVITSPSSGSTSFTTTSVTFVGTAEVESIISTDFSGATATTTDGAWSLTLTLGQGTTAIQFYATDESDNRSEAAAMSVFVDSVSPDVSLTSSTCSGTLASSVCLVATTTLAFSWSSSAGDISYFNIDANGTISTTTDSSRTTLASLNSDGQASYTFKVAAVDTYGNVSATSTQAVEVFIQPVVINEVAWGATYASSADEWIELYNRTSRDISLTNAVLYAADLTPYIPLSGTIAANGYYLIERTDDDTIRTITADLIVPFSGVSGSGLSNSGESLVLALASSTVDTVATCTGATSWCGGSDDTHTTLERYDPSVSGSLTSNWASHMGEFIYNGKDANSTNILGGTPRARNSRNYLIASGGYLSANKTLTAAGSPYLVNRTSVTVAEGATLTIEPGVVIKIVSSSEPWIRVQGTVNANGTLANPVVFTSFYDDEYGGDTNGDGSATAPSAGNWRRILVESTSVGSSFTHTLVRYGGNNNLSDATEKKGAIGVDNATVSFDGLVVEKSNYYGLVLQNSNSTVTNSRFSTSTNSEVSAAGVYISGGAPTISNSVFSGNYRGVTSSGATPALTSNTFISNIQEAVLYSGVISDISNNSGSGNGKNGIVLSSSATTAAGATTTLAVNGLPYLLKGTLTLAANATLSFASGTIVKGWDGSDGVYGRISVPSGTALFSSGTTPSDLIFTSLRDNSVGGTTGSGSPAAGNWYGISVDAGGRLDLSGFTLKYAGSGGMDFPPADSIYKGALKVTGSAATSSGSISNVLFSDNYQSGLNLEGVSSFSVSNATFQNHTEKNSGTATAVYARNSTSMLSAITFSGNTRDGTGSGVNALTCTGCTPSSPNTTPANLFGP